MSSQHKSEAGSVSKATSIVFEMLQQGNPSSSSSIVKGVISLMMSLGVHIGHKTFKTSLEMKPYLYGNRKGESIINLSTTIMQLSSVVAVIAGVIEKGGHILLVGTDPEMSVMVKGMFQGKGPNV
jgi:ribosomal protein S2